MTLDAVADESWKKMADGVARSASRLCDRDGKTCCSGDALSTIFLFAFICALLPTFRFSCLFSYFFPASRYVYLRVTSSVQQQSGTLSKYVFYSTCSFCSCHLYPTPSRNSFVFHSFSIFFRSSYFSGGVFVVVVVLSFSLAFRFSLSHCLTTDLVFFWDEPGRTLGVLLMSLGRKNGLM